MVHPCCIVGHATDHACCVHSKACEKHHIDDSYEPCEKPATRRFVADVTVYLCEEHGEAFANSEELQDFMEVEMDR